MTHVQGQTDFTSCWLSGSDGDSRGSGHVGGPSKWSDVGGSNSDKGQLLHEEAEMRGGEGRQHNPRDKAEFSRR